MKYILVLLDNTDGGRHAQFRMEGAHGKALRERITEEGLIELVWSDPGNRDSMIMKRCWRDHPDDFREFRYLAEDRVPPLPEPLTEL